MLSGIGPAKHLESAGVDCHVNLPGVGENLQDHLEVVTYSSTYFYLFMAVKFCLEDVYLHLFNYSTSTSD